MMASPGIPSEGSIREEPSTQMNLLDVDRQDDDNGPEAVVEEDTWVEFSFAPREASNTGSVSMDPLDAVSQDSDDDTPEVVIDATELMDASRRASHCPPVLQSLTQLTHLLVQKEDPPQDCGRAVVNRCFGIQKGIMYTVVGNTGRKMFSLDKEEDFCGHLYCSLHSFIMPVTDITGCHALTLIKSRAELEVQCPPGLPIGYVICNTNTIWPRLTVENERRKPVLKITGPSCLPLRSGRITFQITSLDGNVVIGTISKCESKAYELQFPLDMDVTLKAVILGACVLIDFMFFQKFKKPWMFCVCGLVMGLLRTATYYGIL